MCCWGPEFQGVEFLVLPHSVAPPCAFLPRSPRPVCPTAPPLVPLPVVLRASCHPRLCPTAPFCPSVPHSCPITSTSALWGSFCAPFPLSITFFGGVSVYPMAAPQPSSPYRECCLRPRPLPQPTPAPRPRPLPHDSPLPIGAPAAHPSPISDVTAPRASQVPSPRAAVLGLPAPRRSRFADDGGAVPAGGGQLQPPPVAEQRVRAGGAARRRGAAGGHAEGQSAALPLPTPAAQTAARGPRAAVHLHPGSGGGAGGRLLPGRGGGSHVVTYTLGVWGGAITKGAWPGAVMRPMVVPDWDGGWVKGQGAGPKGGGVWRGQRGGKRGRGQNGGGVRGRGPKVEEKGRGQRARGQRARGQRARGQRGGPMGVLWGRPL